MTKITRLEKNYNRLCAKLENRERILRMLTRNETEIARLRASLRCRPAKPETPPAPEPISVNQIPETPVSGQPADDGLEIPAYLRRLQALPDPRTKEKKAERKAVAREKIEAELTGKTRKMPLAGKAALDAIRGEA